MALVYKKGGEKVDLAKATVVVLPGITSGYTNKGSALAYMNPFASNVQKAIFEIEIDVSGDIRPMDAKKLAGDDSVS